MDTTFVLIFALRALLETLSLAGEAVRRLGDATDAHPVGALNTLLAELGSDERVSKETTLDEAWLTVERALETETALRIWTTVPSKLGFFAVAPSGATEVQHAELPSGWDRHPGSAWGVQL